MKLKIKENKEMDFLVGIIMLAIGIIMFVGNIYVRSNFFSGRIGIGNVYVGTGVFTIPLVAGLVWMFLSPKKTMPKIITIVGFLLIIIIAVSSISIRVSSIPLYKWIIMLVLIIGGGILTLRALRLARKSK